MTSREIGNYNRKMRYQKRRKVFVKLRKKHGDGKAKRMMLGKDVHFTGSGLKLVSKKKHGALHGRGHKASKNVYRGVYPNAK